jgi:hypothetical protein
VKLENEPNVDAPSCRSIEITAVGHQLIVDPDITFLLSVEQTEQVEQRGFAATRRTHDRVYLPAMRLE